MLVAQCSHSVINEALENNVIGFLVHAWDDDCLQSRTFQLFIGIDSHVLSRHNNLQDETGGRRSKLNRGTLRPCILAHQYPPRCELPVGSYKFTMVSRPERFGLTTWKMIESLQ